MAGIPLFGGFLSKEMFLTAMLAITEFDLFSMDVWGVLFPVLAWIGSVFTFVYSFYFVFHTFAGKHKPEELPKHAHEAPLGMLVSPAILAALVIAIFFIPNLVGDWIVKPAVLAIQPFMYNSPQEVDIHVAAWHGANAEFFMTLGIFAIGGLLFLSFRKWKQAYDAFPDAVSLNRLYDTFMYLSDGGANRFSAVYMTGFIRSYLVYMFGFLVLIVLSTLVLTDAFVLDLTNSAPVGVYEIVILIALVGGTITILAARSRLTAIIALGAVGYSVALFFVIFRAPDLALTQLVIETISVALFLLAFYHLPRVSKKEERMRFKLGNAAIAAGVGTTMTLVALASHSQKVLPSISEYYKETVYTEAGGGNIVNVILVDYRGFDTLFEITVLGIAGIAIITMIKLRLSKKEGQHENK
jgi:multicomponent Na+:H+ antiporter subunit A